MTNITIQNVCLADAAFLTRLMNQPSILHRLHQTPTTQGDWEEAIRLWLQDPDENGYIIFDQAQPIGWFALNGLQSHDKKAYVKIAVLLPEYQDKGIGQLVLSQLLNHLKATGYTAAGLFTDCDNLRAQACYRKCGFQIIAAAEESWPDGSVVKQYEMEKLL